VRLLNGREVWHWDCLGMHIMYVCGCGVGDISRGHSETLVRCHMFYLKDNALYMNFELFLAEA